MITFKKTKTSMDYKDELDSLNEKISEIRKNISYLDVYNIVDVCEDRQKFDAQVNALLPNSSLVINCDGFYSNNERYETGDIILKMSNGNPVHIRAQTGGIFYPSNVSVDDGNNVSITYTFSDSKPTEPSSGEEEIQPSFAKKMTFNLGNINEKTNIYGLWQPVADSFQAWYYDESKTQPINPYIKFYLVKGNTPVEEICLDYTLTLEGESYKVEIDSNLQTSTVYMKVK